MKRSFRIRWWRGRDARPPAEQRAWIHPSELPSFEGLATTETATARSPVPRIVAVVVALLLVVGGIVLMVNRAPSEPPASAPPHVATSLAALPSPARAAAAASVELTITSPRHQSEVAALVLPDNLAVTTTVISPTAFIAGSTATKDSFPVTLVGRDKVMGFSIVRLSATVVPANLGPLPASTEVTVVAPLFLAKDTTADFDWTTTSLGDPKLNGQGVVRYLATKSNADMNDYVDAIAVNGTGAVVAVLSAKDQWYSAQFVARVANVVATGRGCHADFGISGSSEQGGGVLVAKVQPHSAAAVAGLKPGDVITTWNGANLDTWNQLASTLYLTPAYSHAKFTFMQQSDTLHADVTLGCPFKLVP